MGRKMSLADGVDESEIVDNGEVERDVNVVIDDEYGIIATDLNFILVKKKVAHRTGKAEDGVNEGKVIRYIKYEDVAYTGTFGGCLESYGRIVNFEKIKKQTRLAISEVLPLFKETKETIDRIIREYEGR